ncbi:MAG TPA: hypothetical protein VE988_00130 [Gemmataceae bacterium]|nr:hypothetical protein [Gemmataceae bacterium]
MARSIFSDLTEDELHHFQDQHDKLVSLIQSRTGESREAIKNKLNKVAAQLPPPGASASPS